MVEKLQREISELEEERKKLMESQKSKLFEWASAVVRSGKEIEHIKLTGEIREILAEYDSITQRLFDKEVLLAERQDEQAKIDSLG